MPASTLRSDRVTSVDLLRGLVMILMTLDHVRDYLGDPSIRPLDLAHTTPALFLTRWITHICAPTFFLLVGTGAYLSLRHRTKGELSRFLATRGLWLILLEVTVFRCLGYQFNADYRVTMLVILWALGASMIVLAALVHLRTQWIAVFGIALIAVHNAFDKINASQLGAFAPLWNVLHAPGIIIGPPHTVFVSYPLVPWIGVTAVGFALGTVFDWGRERRRQFLVRAGVACLLGFLALRLPNVYGDPVPWSKQPSGVMSVLSVLNVNKYPPSLLFLLVTLGTSLLILRALDSAEPQWLTPARTYGKVPLFYFLLHIPLIHLIAVAVCYVRYGDAHWMFQSPDLGNYPFTTPPGWGFSLPGVYLAWAAVVITLYPLCRWYARLKRERYAAWMSYL